MKRKVLALLLSVSMISLMLVGCGNKAEMQETTTTEKTLETEETVETVEAEVEADDTADLGDPVKLTVSLTAVSTDTHAKAMQKFKESVEDLSGGNITVDLYTDATLFAQEEETVAVAAGDADMVLSSASWLTTGSPWVSMFTAGYMFKSYDHMTTVLNGEIGQEVFQKIADEQSILPLGAWYLGSRQISLTEDKEIKTPEDLSGINLRMPNSDAWLFLGKAIGANPTPISFSELYLSLQTGVVDGQDNPLPTVESAKFYEVQKSITITNHLIDSVWPTMNVDTWNSLTDAQKDIVLQGIEAGREYCDTTNLDKESQLIEFFKEEGLSVYEADINAFTEHVLAVYLDDSISESWDKELYDKVVAAAK